MRNQSPRRRARQVIDAPRHPTLVPFARRLDTLRHDRRLTRRALAKAAQICTNHMQSILHANAPGVGVLMALAAALGVSVGELFTDYEPMPEGYRLVRNADLRELVAIVACLTKEKKHRGEAMER